LPRLHRKDEELTEVRFRASPKTKEWRGDQATTVVLGESASQAWTKEKEIRGRGGGGQRVLPLL
jgi:hypothetical protein